MKRKLTVVFIALFALASVQMMAGELTVNPYGMIRLSSSYETGNAFPSHLALWAKNAANTDGLFHMSANESRFGLKVSGPTIGDFKVTAMVELDFILGGSDTKAKPRMRHAFVKMSNGKTTFLAGQFWDIINPRFAKVVNMIPMWTAGNMGFRRPQIRFEQKFSNFLFQTGLFASLDSDIDGDGIPDGYSAGMPSVQARLMGSFALSKTSGIDLGISGHYGKTKSCFCDSDREWDSYSINLDMELRLTKKLKIVSELFSGQNLAEYWGGIKQGINVAKDTEISSKGFYVNLQYAASKKIDVSLGYGMDDPDDADLSVGNRSKNTSMLANLWYKLNPKLRLGFEVLRLETDYLGIDDQDTTRFGFLVLYIF